MKDIVSTIILTALLSVSTAANAAAYQGWWWDPAKDGMGINIEQQGDTVAAAWYHFDKNRSPTYVLLAGKLENGVLSGELQTASGPPPGQGYDSADVVRNVSGTATLKFITETRATLEYSQNGQNGSLDLERFYSIQHMPLTSSTTGVDKWKYTSNYSGNCGERVSSGYAKMLHADDGYYLITKEDDSGKLCTYHLDLIPAGSSFTGNGKFSCSDGRQGNVAINRMKTSEGFLQFDHSFTETGTEGCDEKGTLIGLSHGPTYFDYINREIRPYHASSLHPYQGWWWDTAHDGMGVNIEEQADRLVVAWYHFDENFSPSYVLLTGSPKHQYIVTPGATKMLLTLTGILQKAEGPPPGPGYDPADVSRTVIGTATITFFPSDTDRFNLHGGANVAVLEYTINNRSGSLNLSRFSMQAEPKTGSWQFVSAASLPMCAISDKGPVSEAFDPYATTGTATLEKTGDKNYRLIVHGGENFKAHGGSGFNCTYNIDLNNGQNGPYFSGNGQVSCIYSGDRPPLHDDTQALSLLIENDFFMFTRVAKETDMYHVCREEFIGFPRGTVGMLNP